MFTCTGSSVKGVNATCANSKDAAAQCFFCIAYVHPYKQVYSFAVRARCSLHTHTSTNNNQELYEHWYNTRQTWGKTLANIETSLSCLK